MHGACHQVCLDRKSLNTKGLSPFSRSKSVAESFRRWDWLFRFWDARCNAATQSEYVAVFGAGSCRLNNLDCRTAHRDGKRFIVRADAKLTAYASKKRRSARQPIKANTR